MITKYPVEEIGVYPIHSIVDDLSSVVWARPTYTINF